MLIYSNQIKLHDVLITVHSNPMLNFYPGFSFLLFTFPM